MPDECECQPTWPNWRDYIPLSLSSGSLGMGYVNYETFARRYLKWKVTPRFQPGDIVVRRRSFTDRLGTRGVVVRAGEHEEDSWIVDMEGERVPGKYWCFPGESLILERRPAAYGCPTSEPVSSSRTS